MHNSNIRITFFTPTKGEFEWTDSLQGLNENEIEELLIHSRSATISLENEISYRRQPREDAILLDYCNALCEDNERIQKEGLTKDQTSRIEELRSVLFEGREIDRSDSKGTWQFLWLVSRVIGWSHALLILCALGKAKLQRLSEGRRIKLFKYLKHHRKALHCPKLEHKAIRHGLNLAHPAALLSCNKIDYSKCKRKLDRSDDTFVEGRGPMMEPVAGSHNTSHYLHGSGALLTTPTLTSDSTRTPHITVSHLPKASGCNAPAEGSITSVVEISASKHYISAPARHSSLNDSQKPRRSLSSAHNRSSESTDHGSEPILTTRMVSDNSLGSRDVLESRDSTEALQDLRWPRSQIQMTRSNTSILSETPAQIIKEIGGLDCDSRDLATILTLLGGSGVSETMLLRAGQPRRFWNNSGEIEEENTLDLVPVLTSNARLKSAIQRLESLGLVTCNAGPPTLRSVLIHPDLGRDIEKRAESPMEWNIRIARFVFYTFPGDSIVEPYFFADIGRSQLPHFQHVVEYFKTSGFVQSFPFKELALAIEGCLSSSQFAGPEWKSKALATAEILIEALPKKDILLSSKVRLRRRTFSRLFPNTSGDRNQHIDPIKLMPDNPKLNACFGETILSEVQEMIDRKELSSAWSELEKFKPLHGRHLSTLEENVMQQIRFFKGRVSRFQGRFDTAKGYLSPLSYTAKHDGIQCGVISHLVAVKCELGEIDTARELIQNDLYEAQQRNPLDVPKGRRLKLVSAETHLMKALWMIKNGKAPQTHYVALHTNKESEQWPLSKEGQDSLEAAWVIYQELQENHKSVTRPGKVAKLNHFRVSTGQAMISHIKGQWVAAYSQWEHAAHLAEVYWGSDFALMISLYSMCDVMLRLGEPRGSKNLAKQAEGIFARSGRQHYLLALGSLWFDAIGDSVHRNGGCKIREVA